MFTGILITTSCSSRPALPGQAQEPEGLNEYLEAANTSLEQSRLEVKKAEAAVLESRKLLDEAKSLHHSMTKLKIEQETAMKRVRAERTSLERKKAEEERLKREEEEKLKQQAEATPTPPPYSPSDAPPPKKTN